MKAAVLALFVLLPLLHAAPPNVVIILADDLGYADLALNAKLSTRKRTVEELQARGAVAGSASQIREQLAVLEDAGLQRIMLQWLDLDDLDGLEALGKAVL